jgi:hypothetical protein
MLLATTAQSFKGYDSEVVIIPAADQYTAGWKGVLATSLYVAMTRARSILTMFAQTRGNQHAKQLYRIVEDCLDNLHERPQVESEFSPQDDLVDILDRIGTEHRKWLIGLWTKYRYTQEPLLTKDGEIVAEPLFWFKAGNATYACFGRETPSQRIVQRLEDCGISVLEVGMTLSGSD